MSFSLPVFFLITIIIKSEILYYSIMVTKIVQNSGVRNLRGT